MTKDEQRLLAQFRTAHLPEPLANVSLIFARAARELAENTPATPERTLALRKLFEAKNYAVMGYILHGEEHGH